MQKNRPLVLFIITALLTVSMACASLFPKSANNSVVAGNISQKFDPPPPFDPKAPMPSASASALRTLEAFEPGVAGLESDVAAAEGAALKALFADVQAKLGAGKTSQAPAPQMQSGGVKLAISALKNPVPAGANPADYFADSIDTAPTTKMITGLLNGWNDMLTPDVPVGPGVSGSFPETVGGTKTTDSLNLSRDADGSTHFGFGVKTESTKNGVSARTEIAGNLDGKRCPDANGQVAFTIKERVGAESGGTGYTQDLTANVRAVVDDAARVGSFTVDVTQGTRQVKPGHQVYVETGATFKFDDANLGTTSNVRLIRNSQDATPADVSDLSASGHTAAGTMGYSALKMAEQNWLDGGCTKIVAASPGTVTPGSTTAIPVTVVQRFDGSVLSAKLEAALTGAQSIAPTSLAKTPGTLSYTAPNEKGKSAAILLTATSRRGKATLQLTANTGEKFSANGTWGNATLTGLTDSLNSPLTLSSTGGGDGSCSGKVVFSGGATGGDVSCSQTCSGLYFEGTGSYTIAITKDGGTISGQCSSYLPASGGLDTPDQEPIKVTLQRVP